MAGILIGAFVALAATQAHGQSASATDRPGAFFVEGAWLTTGIRNDTQEGYPGFLHYAYTGQLDWPQMGALLAGGVRVARGISVGAELTIRRLNSTTISERSYGHSDTETLASLYSSRERLLSITGRAHLRARAVNIQPLGGLTISRAERTLTGRRGFVVLSGFPTSAFSAPDARLAETRAGLVGGADIAVHVGRSVALVGSSRVYWIAREHVDEYVHVVPNAVRLILSLGAGVQWWPRGGGQQVER
jgi:hypothetical protein